MNDDCASFERWLDAGQPAPHESVARAHAAACARCAALLELEGLLALPPSAPAPEGFAAAVMERVRVPVRARWYADPALAPVETPWWIDLAVQPAVLLALVVAAALVGWRETLWKLGLDLAVRAEALSWPASSAPHDPLFAASSRWLAELSSQPVTLAAVVFALSFGALALSWPLYRWTEHLVAHAMPHFSTRPAVAR